MKKSALCCVLLLGLSTIAYCGQMSKIELNDGSVIEGEVISFDKGIYTVNTPSLGEVKIEVSKIRRIGIENTTPLAAINTPPEAANASTLPSSDAIKSEMNRISSKITNNPDIMQTMASLLLDPQFQEILKDPEIADAVKSQNIKALMENEKFLSILNNQKLREIQNKLKDQDK